jgi:hypothetical protein
MRLFAGVLQSPELFRKLSRCLHTAEVAGSKPASPTHKRGVLQVKYQSKVETPDICQAPVQQRTKTPVNWSSPASAGYLIKQFQKSTLASWHSAPALKVSTNGLPVPKVLSPKRLLQRMLFLKNILVDDSCHDRKRCDHPCVARDKGGSEIEQGPTDIHRVAADGVGPARNECGGLLYVDTGSGSHCRCRDRNSGPEKNPSGIAV